MLVRAVFQQEGQRFLNALFAVVRAEVVALMRDAQGSQTEARRRNAGNAAHRQAHSWSAIPDHPRARAAFVKEKVAGSPLQIVQHRLPVPRHLGKRVIDECPGRVRILLGGLRFRLRPLSRLNLRRLVLVLPQSQCGGAQRQHAGGTGSTQQFSSGYGRRSQSRLVLILKISTVLRSVSRSGSPLIVTSDAIADSPFPNV